MYVYDFIAIMLIGISHIMLYIQLISYNRLSNRMMIALSIVFTLLLGVVITVTGYLEFNIIMLLLFLLSLGLMQTELTFKQNLYFALVSMISITLVKMVLMELSINIMMRTSFNLYGWADSAIHLIVSSIILLSVGVLSKQIQKLAQSIIESSFYYVSYALLIIGLIVALIWTKPSINLLATFHKHYGDVSYSAALILLFILLLFVLIGSHLTKERMLKEQQDRLDNELLDYIAKLELMHDELATFRHDYMNILLTLDEGVRTKDITQIEKIYYEAIAPTSNLINNQELDIGKLSLIKVPEIKSVLSVKLIQAQQQNIHLTIDIPQEIKDITMPIVNFIRMISILIDNGIEEANHSKDKILQIAFFEMEQSQYFIVRNSYRQKMIDLEQIYKKYYSNKKGNRGYGLYSLKLMIDKTNHATLETTLTTPYFTQSLIIKKQ